MFWIIFLPSLPFLYWLWLGIAFTIVDYVIHQSNKELAYGYQRH